MFREQGGGVGGRGGEHTDDVETWWAVAVGEGRLATDGEVVVERR